MFIENESGDVSKRKAFIVWPRNLKRHSKDYPLCILGNSLYTCKNVFNLCEDSKWKYLLHLKEDSIKSVAQEFRALRGAKPVFYQSDPKEDISSVIEIASKEHKLHVLDYELEIEKDKDNRKLSGKWAFIRLISFVSVPPSHDISLLKSSI